MLGCNSKRKNHSVTFPGVNNPVYGASGKDKLGSSVTKYLRDPGQVTDPLLGSSDFIIKTGVINTCPQGLDSHYCQKGEGMSDKGLRKLNFPFIGKRANKSNDIYNNNNVVL